MQPNYQGPPQQTSNNRFDFITNSSQPKKSPIFNQTSKKTRIFVILGLIIGVIIMSVVVMNLLNSGSKEQSQRLIELGKSQSEIIRLSTIAQTNAKSLDTRNYASTIKSSMSSSQIKINKLITSSGVSSIELNKQLSLSKNAKNDSALNEASQNGRFDEVYKELIAIQLNTYAQKISNLYNNGSPAQKATLKKAYDQALIIQGPKSS